MQQRRRVDQITFRNGLSRPQTRRRQNSEHESECGGASSEHSAYLLHKSIAASNPDETDESRHAAELLSFDRGEKPAEQPIQEHHFHLAMDASGLVRCGPELRLPPAEWLV